MGKESDMNNQNILEIKGLNVSYPENPFAIKDFSVSIQSNRVVSLIGPLYSGKSTLLRSLNRLNELYPSIKTKGEVIFNGKNIFEMNSIEVRKKIGLIFKDPHIFPNMNIYDNVISGYTLNGIKLSKQEKDEIVEEMLTNVSLWDDVKDELNKKPLFLSKGEQQRLCIARTIALKPDILLMDEPTSHMSSYCTNRIEDLIHRYKINHIVLVATPNLSQAARISDYTMYIENGELVEYQETAKLFWNPLDKRTENFINSLSE